MAPTGSSVQTIVIILVVAIIYFIPWAVAKSAKKRNSGAIFALNLFLGWTFIGWVVALVWALAKDK